MTEAWSPQQPLWRGGLILALGMGGFLAWSLLTQIDGAVVVSGQVTVEARRQAIQHPDGGLVAALHVRDGSTVAQGDPILTLDGTDLIGQAAVTRREWVEVLAQLDRLQAEALDLDRITFRAELVAPQAEVAALQDILADETRLFQARRDTLRQADAQIAERQVQTEAVILGRERQRDATRMQLDLINEDLAVQQSLADRGLTPTARVTALRRESARLQGTLGELEAGIAETRSAIAGHEVERLRQRAAFRERALAEMRDLQPRAEELRERLVLIEARIERLVLRAPMAGSVLGLSVHTIGGVVQAGREIAFVVPAETPLTLSVEIDPAQIDRVHTGQPAVIRFPLFNSRTTPEVSGHVTSVSADAMTDPATGRRMFLADLALAPDAVQSLGDVTLQPGMPVEAFLRTDARTPASFLFKPLADYWAYAFREE